VKGLLLSPLAISLPAVAFIFGTNLMVPAFVNLFTFVVFKACFFSYLLRFFNVFYLISSILDFSISSRSAHRSIFVLSLPFPPK